MNFLFATLFLLLSCNTSLDETPPDLKSNTPVDAAFDLAEHQKKYKQLKTSIAERKSVLSVSRMQQELKENQAKEYISTVLIDSIFPYWVGTTWDFNGITTTPRSGDIACGYFVSTTLLDLGFKLNRYKTAQKAASDIVKQLCLPSSISTLGSLEKLNFYLTDIPDLEILIVGLDFHVGFIFKKDNVAYFAHSNYIEREGVIIEPLNTSSAIKASKAYVIGNVSQNKALISTWLQ